VGNVACFIRKRCGIEVRLIGPRRVFGSSAFFHPRGQRRVGGKTVQLGSRLGRHGSRGRRGVRDGDRYHVLEMFGTFRPTAGGRRRRVSRLRSVDVEVAREHGFSFFRRTTRDDWIGGYQVHGGAFSRAFSGRAFRGSREYRRVFWPVGELAGVVIPVPGSRKRGDEVDEGASELHFGTGRRRAPCRPRGRAWGRDAPRVSRRAQHRTLRRVHVDVLRVQARSHLVPQRRDTNGHRAEREPLWPFQKWHEH
jgi:hypothetical protein